MLYSCSYILSISLSTYQYYCQREKQSIKKKKTVNPKEYTKNMPGFSTFTVFTAGLAALSSLASAYTQPKGASPSGNSIYEPGLNSLVPVGKAFTITWEPTTKGAVSLLLCKGPSTNCVITQTLADSIENSGSFSWTPSSDLAPSQPTGYGIQLVVEGTGQYQCM